MEHRTLTIMFTDMKGFSSRTSVQSREATMEMIKKHKELLLPVISEKGGSLVKTIGDAFLVTFESPTNAVLAGVALQETLEKHNASAEDSGRIEIRVAINTGEVGLEDNDVYGEAVNIASRLQGLTNAGEISFSESTYLSMSKSEVSCTEVGYRSLKGIPHRVKVYKVVREKELASGKFYRKGEFLIFDTPRAPRWRRVLAFALDVGLIALMTGVLMGGQMREWGRAVEDLGAKEQEIRTTLQNIAESGETDDLLNFGNALQGFRSEFEQGKADFEKRKKELEEAEKEMRQRGDVAPEEWAQLDQFREELAQFEAELQDRDQTLTQEAHQFESQVFEQQSLRRQAMVTLENLQDLLYGDEEISKESPFQEAIEDFRRMSREVSDWEGAVHVQFALCWLVVFLLYSTLSLGIKGRTVGKTLFKLRVLRANGESLNWPASFIRSLLYFLSLAPFGLGFFWGLIDRQGQAWHDKIAETRVIHEI